MLWLELRLSPRLRRMGLWLGDRGGGEERRRRRPGLRLYRLGIGVMLSRVQSMPLDLSSLFKLGNDINMKVTSKANNKVEALLLMHCSENVFR